MITLVTTFKPFAGEDLINQLNALASWRALGGDVQILVFGDTPIPERARRFGIEESRDTPLSPEGFPRIDLILESASREARYDLIAYLNGDIILGPDFVDALTSISLPRFLMVGQRTDVDISEPLYLSDPVSRDKTLSRLRRSGRLHRVAGMDYFAFRRGALPALPTLYAGAAGWDNVTVYLCRRHSLPVIDATLDVVALHPNHDYRRLRNGSTVAFDGVTAAKNSGQLPPGVPRFYTTDADYFLEAGRLKSALASPRHAWRLVHTYPIVRGWNGACRLPFRAAGGLLKRLGYLWIALFWRCSSRPRKTVRNYEISYRRRRPKIPSPGIASNLRRNPPEVVS